MANVLVIQEIEKNTAFVRSALEPQGHNVLAVQEPSEAKRVLAKEQVDVVICAVHLNYGDVFEFLMWLKKHPLHSNLPFVFFCAEPTEFAKYVSPVVTSAARIIGVADHITMEEFDAGNFSQRIHAALNTDHGLSMFQKEHQSQNGVKEHSRSLKIEQFAADAFAGARNLAAKKAAQDVG